MHEAAAAAARAAELMQEHQIVEAQLRIDDDETIPEPVIEGVGEEAATRQARWRRNLLDACITSVGGHSWSHPIKVDGEWKREIRLFGRESAVQTAKYEFLAHDLERFANADYCASGMKENSRSYKHGYYINAVNEIERRLIKSRHKFEQQTKSAATGTALAIIETDQKAVDEEWKRRSANHTTSSYYAPTSVAGSAAGRARGATMNLGGGGKGIGAPVKRIGN